MPLLPVTVALDTVAVTTLVEPSQLIGALFVSEATEGAQYFLRIGQAEPAGPFTGAGLTLRMSTAPERERRAGLYLVNKTATPGGVVVIQVSYSAL